MEVIGGKVNSKLNPNLSLYPKFPHLFSDLCKILYSRSAHEAAEYLLVWLESAEGRFHFYYGGE